MRTLFPHAVYFGLKESAENVPSWYGPYKFRGALSFKPNTGARKLAVML